MAGSIARNCPESTGNGPLGRARAVPEGAAGATGGRAGGAHVEAADLRGTVRRHERVAVPVRELLEERRVGGERELDATAARDLDIPKLLDGVGAHEMVDVEP